MTRPKKFGKSKMTINSFLLKRQLDGHTSWNKAFLFPLKFINLYWCFQNVTYAILLNDWQLPIDTFKNLHSSEALLTMWLLSNYFPSNPRYSHNLVSKSVRLDYLFVFCSFGFTIQSINSCKTAISGMQIDHSFFTCGALPLDLYQHTAIRCFNII